MSLKQYLSLTAQSDIQSMFGSKNDEKNIKFELNNNSFIVNGKQDHDRVMAKYPFNNISIVSDEIIKNKSFSLAGEERTEFIVLKDEAGNNVNPTQLAEIKVFFVHKTFRDVLVNLNFLKSYLIFFLIKIFFVHIFSLNFLYHYSIQQKFL